jgi:hypothetical protein
MFTYDEELFSDLHKDAYGFRPRIHNFYKSTPEEKQKIWDATILDMNAAQEAEEARAADCVKDFKAEVDMVINTFGAEDRATALKWITDGDRFFFSRQDVEGWVYNRGILFTDYGRTLVEELMKIVQFGYNNRSKENVW